MQIADEMLDSKREMKDLMFKYRDAWLEDPGPGMVPEHRLNEYRCAESKMPSESKIFVAHLYISDTVRYAPK